MRQEGKHTPGNWHVEEHNEQFEVWSDDPRVSVADCFYHDKGKANAALIAAAPDLLKALQAQMCWRMRDGSPCSCPAGKDEDEPKGKMPSTHATDCQMARNALAKALNQGEPNAQG